MSVEALWTKRLGPRADSRRSVQAGCHDATTPRRHDGDVNRYAPPEPTIPEPDQCCEGRDGGTDRQGRVASDLGPARADLVPFASSLSHARMETAVEVEEDP